MMYGETSNKINSRSLLEIKLCVRTGFLKYNVNKICVFFIMLSINRRDVRNYFDSKTHISFENDPTDS